MNELAFYYKNGQYTISVNAPNSPQTCLPIAFIPLTLLPFKTKTEKEFLRAQFSIKTSA